MSELNLKIVEKYAKFFERTKNEPITIIQGSKRSGKTFAVLQHLGVDFFNSSNKKIQGFSASPKQQNFGLMSDFKNIFNPILGAVKTNSTQKTFRYGTSEFAFINIADNTNANDIANSLGACDTRYMNECNMFSKSMFEKLLINNRGQMFLDFNPYREFWVSEFVTDKNFLKTTFRDNPFLTKPQIALFNKWIEVGKRSEVGSYDYWRWQVMCEGNYSQLTGKVFTTENIHFVSSLPGYLHTYIIFADPSNAKGGDNFALTLTAIDGNGNVYLVDSFSSNRIEKVLIAEKIKEWQRDYQIERTYVETNGQIGLKFYNDCVTSDIDVDGWYSRQDKYERIMANFDVITEKLFILDTNNNREFAQQFYTFQSPDAKDDFGKKAEFKDDNIDCVNNAILAYILVYGELKILF